ncbi:hypothetical protein VIGAN_10175200, partial [Vigna angularis var. angularis]
VVFGHSQILLSHLIYRVPRQEAHPLCLVLRRHQKVDALKEAEPRGGHRRRRHHPLVALHQHLRSFLRPLLRTSAVTLAQSHRLPFTLLQRCRRRKTQCRRRQTQCRRRFYPPRWFSNAQCIREGRE